MRLKKKLLALLLAAGCTISLFGCRQDEPAAVSLEPSDPAVSEQPGASPAVELAAPYVPADDSPKLLDDAKWIWAETEANNTWVNFRKAFTLNAVPQECRAEIAVENTYFLWVNGQSVVYDGGLKRGDDRTSGYFDRVDLAPYLREGENVIAVKAWFWGVKGEEAQSYSNVPVDRAGFLFAMEADGQSTVSDSSWKALWDEAFKDDTLEGYDTAQPNIRFPEYNIYYDANDAQDSGWTEAGFDDSGWAGAQERGRYRDAPWNELHLRPIPLIREFGLRDYLNSGAYEGYTTTDAEEITVELPYNAQFTPYLKVSADRRAEIAILTENTQSTESVRTTYVTHPNGEQEFESPGWISGQRATYVIPAGVTVLSLQYRESGYDTQLSGGFSMDIEFFDTLWQMGARTQYLCMRENFMDCPDRERAQWTGDATSQMRQMMYCLDPNSYALYQKMIRQKAGWVETDSAQRQYNDLLLTVMPIYNELYELPAQEMAGIIGLWDYYLYTGDSSVLYIMYEPAVNYLQKWNIGSDGLVKHKTGQGLVDWQDTGASKVDTRVSENAWYYWCLDTVRNMGEATGQDTAWATETMSALYEGYQALWVDGLGYATGGAADDRSNALAVLAGLAPAERYEDILNALKTERQASSYMEAYVLQAMCEMGAVDAALDRMEERYGEMVRTNLDTGYTTLWEYFEAGTGTLNHAWSAGPVYILSRYVGGVRPTAPGYKTYEIVPDFSHSNHVALNADSVIGMIRVDAQIDGNAGDCNMALELPQGGAAIVAVPNPGGGTVTVNGAAAERTPGAEAGGAVFQAENEGYCYF